MAINASPKCEGAPQLSYQREMIEITLNGDFEESQRFDVSLALHEALERK